MVNHRGLRTDTILILSRKLGLSDVNKCLEQIKYLHMSSVYSTLNEEPSRIGQPWPSLYIERIVVLIQESICIQYKRQVYYHMYYILGDHESCVECILPPTPPQSKKNAQNMKNLVMPKLIKPKISFILFYFIKVLIQESICIQYKRQVYYHMYYILGDHESCVE